jgi:hypothetical protein
MQPSSDVRVGARRATQMRARTIRRSTPHCDGGRPGRDVRKGLWSALQTHLQGVDGATLAIVPENCRHCAALLSRSGYRAKNSRALKGRQARASSKSNRESPGRSRMQLLLRASRPLLRDFRKIRRWRACARFRRRWRHCGRPARRSARSAGACRGNSPAPRRSPRPRGS